MSKVATKVEAVPSVQAAVASVPGRTAFSAFVPVGVNGAPASNSFNLGPAATSDDMSLHQHVLPSLRMFQSHEIMKHGSPIGGSSPGSSSSPQYLSSSSSIDMNGVHPVVGNMAFAGHLATGLHPRMAPNGSVVFMPYGQVRGPHSGPPMTVLSEAHALSMLSTGTSPNASTDNPQLLRHEGPMPMYYSAPVAMGPMGAAQGANFARNAHDGISFGGQHAVAHALHGGRVPSINNPSAPRPDGTFQQTVTGFMQFQTPTPNGAVRPVGRSSVRAPVPLTDGQRGVQSIPPYAPSGLATDSAYLDFQSRREVHRVIERRRRDHINAGIDDLSRIVPGRHRSRGNTVHRTVQFIRHVLACEERLQRESKLWQDHYAGYINYLEGLLKAKCIDLADARGQPPPTSEDLTALTRYPQPPPPAPAFGLRNSFLQETERTDARDPERNHADDNNASEPEDAFTYFVQNQGSRPSESTRTTTVGCEMEAASPVQDETGSNSAAGTVVVATTVKDEASEGQKA